MSRTRHILAVVAVTTALCADQVVSAAPLSKPPVCEMAARLVNRLSQSFRRTVPNSMPVAERSAALPRRDLHRETPGANLAILHPALSPFQFRLPPPAC